MRRARARRVQIILDRTPFYAESGGQIGDTGEIRAAGGRVEVRDTIKKGDLFVHQKRAWSSPASSARATR